MAWIDIVDQLIADECRGKKSEFFRRTGLKGGNLDWWKTHPDAEPQIPTIERIEKGLNVRIVMDEHGHPVGVERISADDIDNKTDASDIQTKSSEISEDEVYARYDAVRRRAGLPPLENLDDDTRSALRRRIVKLENEITAIVSLGENDIISIVGNENTTSREK